ncbi:MAG: nucleotide exchange factor GrpE [Clostridia bacterium]|nr:nucleotide exchange factor GrpE [Clostridia bacterium]
MAEDIKKETAEETVEEAASEVNDAQPEEKAEKKKKEKKSKDKEALEKLQAEFDEYKKAHLRVLAEYDNYRKRTANEKLQTYGNAVSDTVQAILPVADNMDRALSLENGDLDSFKKGVEMIANQFSLAFDKLGITAYGEVGDVFDPELHTAIGMVDSDELESGVIANVFQKGYKLNDKVIRLAMVQVTN